MLRPSLLAALAATLVAAASASAAPFQSDVIDGPTPEISAVGDVDIARDGTGAVVYLKREGAVDHVWASRLVGGVWQPPERLDAALGAPASQPVVAAADGGRVTAAFTSGGALYAVARPAGATAFSQPQLLAASGSNPSIDLSINDVGWISFTTPGASTADLRVARKDRNATDFRVLPDALDISGANDVATGTSRSDVAVAADGTGVVVWGEANRVFARRVFQDRISASPQDLTLDGGGAADLPDIDMEDDSSYAWAVFRQRREDGRLRAIARRLVGSTFEAPAVVDGFGAPDDVRTVHIDISGRGAGVASTGSAGSGAFDALVHDDRFFPGALVNGTANEPHPRPGIAENNDAFSSFFTGASAGDAGVGLTAYDLDPAKRTVPPPGPVWGISNPGFGPADLRAGMDFGVNRAGDAVAVFVQGTGADRRLVAGGFDRVPGAFRTYTSSKFRKFARPRLSWSPSFDLWGPVTYRVEIDGQVVGETTETRATLPNVVPDGEHSWRVVATDRRGQSAATPSRTLRVDATPPDVLVRVRGDRTRGKTLTVDVRAADGSLERPAGSGVKQVRIDWGDGARSIARQAKHRYARGGTYTLRVTATDRVGNVTVERKRLRIKRK